MASDESVPIRYTLVEQSELVSRGTAFHVLSQAEYELLRCFMALLQLPTSTEDLLVGRPPFVAAASRASRLPSFRKAQTKLQPPPPLWEDMNTSPLGDTHGRERCACGLNRWQHTETLAC